MKTGSEHGFTLCLNCGWEQRGPVDLDEHFPVGPDGRRCKNRPTNRLVVETNAGVLVEDRHGILRAKHA